MNSIGNKDRLVLLALEKLSAGSTEMSLAIATGMEFGDVQASIVRLEQIHRVERMEHGSKTYFFAAPLSEAPLFAYWEEWLDFFCEVHSPVTEGDTLATTYDCLGVVVLTALLSGNRDAEFIVRVSSLPLDFISLVLGLADRLKIWWLDSLFELQELLRDSNKALSEIDSCLQYVKENFWEICWTPGIEEALQDLRAGRQFGGKIDMWIADEEGFNSNSSASTDCAFRGSERGPRLVT
jgi:hypothetical protein